MIRPLPRPVLAVLALATSIAVGCAAGDDGADGGPGGKADDPFAASRDIDVLLTAPFCDVCDQGDKDLLKARSPITAAVIDAIDNAERTLDIAQFTFSVKEIEQAILRAKADGVEIRMAMNIRQADGDTVSRRLADAGVNVKFVKGRPAQGGGFDGLQHAKFLIADRSLLLTGSNNWSSTGTTINNENTTVIRSTADDPSTDPILAGFACHFDAMFDEDFEAASACSNDQVAFTPGSGAIKLIERELRAADKTIDVLMHHLLFSDLIKELAKRAEAGVRVRLVLNAADRDEVKGSAWNRLLAAGAQVRFKQTNPDLFQIMHHKLVIVDGRVVVNGSGNWSGSAFFNNYENYVRYAQPDVVRPYRHLFARLWTWSLTADSLDAGRTAAEQDVLERRVFFGNLHAHFAANDGGDLLDDGKAERSDGSGGSVGVDTGATIAAAGRFAYEYARDLGEMDFLMLSPHTTDDQQDDPADLASMSRGGYLELVDTATDVTSESSGAFVALPGMEWSTNSTGNHVNVIGASSVAKTERGRFDLLYGEYLPERAHAGDTPILSFNHPRTFRKQDVSLDGNWDQIFDINLMEITRTGDRSKKFNDYGLDDFAPLSDVRQSWVLGEALPDQAVVDATLANLRAAASPYLRLMEVTVGRGSELDGETPVNPSIVDDLETGLPVRFTRVHTDWDYYLLEGFELAPTAPHDNHRANWGTGHTSRTAVIADELSADSLIAALDQRSVYASEDQNLEVRLYADGRVPMGGRIATRAPSIELDLRVVDPDYSGTYEVRVFVGTIGDDSVAIVDTRTPTDGATDRFALPLPGPGRHFVYVEVHQVDVDRMAWSAPIFVEAL